MYTLLHILLYYRVKGAGKDVKSYSGTNNELIYYRSDQDIPGAYFETPVDHYCFFAGLFCFTAVAEVYVSSSVYGIEFPDLFI
jgi:hypothetical protein